MFDNQLDTGNNSRMLCVVIDEGAGTAELSWEKKLTANTPHFGDNNLLPSGNHLGRSPRGGVAGGGPRASCRRISLVSLLARSLAHCPPVKNDAGARAGLRPLGLVPSSSSSSFVVTANEAQTRNSSFPLPELPPPPPPSVAAIANAPATAAAAARVLLALSAGRVR